MHTRTRTFSPAPKAELSTSMAAMPVHSLLKPAWSFSLASAFIGTSSKGAKAEARSRAAAASSQFLVPRARVSNSSAREP